MTTGEKIRELRKAKHMTMSQLAEKTGMSLAAISRYEIDNRFPRADNLEKIADVLGVSWMELMNPDDAPMQQKQAGARPAITQLIGTPATLEQLAEECAELGQAALKLARKLRGENPTPKAKEELLENLTEEVADVLLCIEQVDLDADKIESIKVYKAARWRQRIEDMNHEN